MTIAVPNHPPPTSRTPFSYFCVRQYATKSPGKNSLSALGLALSAVFNALESWAWASDTRAADRIAWLRANNGLCKEDVPARTHGSSWTRSEGTLGFLPKTCWQGLRPWWFSPSFLLFMVSRIQLWYSSFVVGWTASSTFWRMVSNKWPCFSTLPNWLCASAAVLITLIPSCSKRPAKASDKFVCAGSTITSTGRPAHFIQFSSKSRCNKGPVSTS